METSITHRFPRPLGITALSTEYQQNPSQEGLTRLFNYIINFWFMNNGVICGKAYDKNSLCMLFNIDPHYINEFMSAQIVTSRIWDKSKQDDLLNGLISEQLAWALEDRMEVSQQLSLLKASQGNKYTPFVTAEVNKALKLRLESSTSLQSIIRNLTGGGSTNLFINNHTENNVNNTNYITIEEARALVLDSCKSLPKSDEVKLLEAKYDIGSLPEVVAKHQTGVDTSKEGLNLKGIELNAITDNYKGAIEVSSKEHHELRREIEQNIDPYEEDPELAIYEEDFDELEDQSMNSYSISSQFL